MGFTRKLDKIRGIDTVKKIGGSGKIDDGSGSYLKSLVYGGLDGIITTFAVVAGVAGASLNASIVLIMGFANLIGDGISMAVGDYLSTKSEQEYNQSKGVEKDTHNPFKNAYITFFSFLLFGLVPLLAYLYAAIFDVSSSMFVYSIILAAIILFVLGAFKSKLTGHSMIRSGAEMLIIGGIAAAAAYLVGYFIAGLV